MKLTDFLKFRGLSGSGSSSEYLSGTGIFSTPAGGSASDMLGTLTAAEISITGTGITGTISRMHVCSGTSADYTVTLPAASGNTGKLIGFRMATGLTKLVTLDGNASETIDGSLTRIMWAGESAILLCDGSNWFKVAGKPLPMVCSMNRSTNQTAVVPSTSTTITINNVLFDNTGMMGNTGSTRIDVKRTANYITNCVVRWATSPSQADCSAYFRKNATTDFIQVGCVPFGATSFVAPTSQSSAIQSLTAGDYLNLRGYQTSSGNCDVAGLDSSLTLVEIPAW